MAFHDGSVRWFPFGDFTDFEVHILRADPERRVVDFLVRFEPNSRIQLHRHLAETNTLVLQGEHRLYDPDGTLSDVRSVGTYTSSPAGPEHREGAGDERSVVHYSMRSDQELLFEFLDYDMSVLARLTIQDIAAAWEQQQAAPVS